MKKIILHITILFILIVLTSFDAEKSGNTIKNFYQVDQIENTSSLVVTKINQKGKTNYYYYNYQNQLTRISYSESLFRIFTYNKKGQLIRSELVDNGEIVDKEILNWNGNYISKTDYNLINNQWFASYQENYSLNNSNQIERIQSYIFDAEGNSEELNKYIIYQWEYNKLESIESKGFRFDSKADLLEKMDYYSNIEYLSVAKKSHVKLDVDYTFVGSFLPMSFNIQNIETMLSNQESRYYLSFFENGKRQEVVKYYINKETYPIEISVHFKQSKGNTQSFHYSYEFI